MTTLHAQTTNPLAGEKCVLLFDNICNLCCYSVQLILRYNKNESVKFASVQSGLGQRVLSYYGMQTDTFVTMLYIEEGRLFTKSTAALRIAKQLRFPWYMLYGFVCLPRPLRDWFYDRVAMNRYRIFGRRNQCFLPDEKTLARFL